MHEKSESSILFQAKKSDFSRVKTKLFGSLQLYTFVWNLNTCLWKKSESSYLTYLIRNLNRYFIIWSHNKNLGRSVNHSECRQKFSNKTFSKKPGKAHLKSNAISKNSTYFKTLLPWSQKLFMKQCYMLNYKYRYSKSECGSSTIKYQATVAIKNVTSWNIPKFCF